MRSMHHNKIEGNNHGNQTKHPADHEAQLVKGDPAFPEVDLRDYASENGESASAQLNKQP